MNEENIDKLLEMFPNAIPLSVVHSWGSSVFYTADHFSKIYSNYLLLSNITDDELLVIKLLGIKLLDIGNDADEILQERDCISYPNISWKEMAKQTNG